MIFVCCVKFGAKILDHYIKDQVYQQKIAAEYFLQIGWKGCGGNAPNGCSPGTVIKYKKRISDPLLNRIDIHSEVPRVEYDKQIAPAHLAEALQYRPRMDAV